MRTLVLFALTTFATGALASDALAFGKRGRGGGCYGGGFGGGCHGGGWGGGGYGGGCHGGFHGHHGYGGGCHGGFHGHHGHHGYGGGCHGGFHGHHGYGGGIGYSAQPMYGTGYTGGYSTPTYSSYPSVSGQPTTYVNGSSQQYLRGTDGQVYVRGADGTYYSTTTLSGGQLRQPVYGTYPGTYRYPAGVYPAGYPGTYYTPPIVMPGVIPAGGTTIPPPGIPQPMGPGK